MGVGAQLHAFLISALYGDECSAPRSGRCTAEKEALVTAGNEVVLASGIDLDALKNRIILPYWGCTDSSHSSVLVSYKYRTI
jgi:hypothetical protein